MTNTTVFVLCATFLAGGIFIGDRAELYFKNKDGVARYEVTINSKINYPLTITLPNNVGEITFQANANKKEIKYIIVNGHGAWEKPISMATDTVSWPTGTMGSFIYDNRMHIK